MKKIISSLLAVAFLAGATMPLPARAALYIQGGDLVRCPDLSTVYFIGDDGNRYVFLDEKTFYTWYQDFSTVLTVSCHDLGEFPLAGVVTYQMGTRMVKVQSDPRVYAVTGPGELRQIPDEETAEMIYGAHWNLYIDDVPDGFWARYEKGAPLTHMEVPDGTKVYLAEEDRYHYFLAGQPYRLPSSFAYDHGVQLEHVIIESQAPELYARTNPSFDENLQMISLEHYDTLDIPVVTDTADEFPVVEVIDWEEVKTPFLLSLERGGCFGDCPTYAIAIAVDEDSREGVGVFKGYTNTEVIGERRFTLTEDQMSALQAKIELGGFFTLKDRYDSDPTGDASETEIGIVLDDQAKTIIFDWGPTSLLELEEYILELTGADVWIGITPE